ncbi:type IX secretion system protein PorQ [Aureibaculum sp. A20]|uniref:Type IX secretion system protein PorQ n=1 Tax=Aureibaculum flavum TaxID=2795986 RepID=A0ABS0WXC9_9FLAO|nr:type IX secretion system protein PorQ [Aureibaculum flavum]MBJ2176541.1 type IX secretion system protein PorQ [Aureibaculum flavum]
MKQILIIVILSISNFSLAQVGGENVFNFLNVSTSARQAALGGEVLTLYDDVNQPLWNPSTINKEIDNQASVSYVDFLADINYGSATFAHLINRRIGTLHAGVTYVNYGTFIGADENGQETGTFKARDLALSVGYAYRIPKSNFHAGANLKYISSSIENYTSNGIAVDFGLTYFNDTKPFIVSAVIRNIGYQINVFDEERESLPLEIAVGASYKLANVPLQWHVTLDNLQKWNVAVSNPSDSQTSIDGETSNDNISFLDNAFRHVVVGAELFPDKVFNLRLGYSFRRGKELRLTESRTFAGLSAGFGLQLGRLKFNYAFTKYHPVTNTNTFTLNINLAKKNFNK